MTKPSDISMENQKELAVIKSEVNIMKEQNNRDHQEIKNCINDIDKKLDIVIDRKVSVEEFIFWRNILISGIILSTFMMIISIFLRS